MGIKTIRLDEDQIEIIKPKLKFENDMKCLIEEVASKLRDAKKSVWDAVSDTTGIKVDKEKHAVLNAAEWTVTYFEK